MTVVDGAPDHNEVVCECCDEEWAQDIADMLNAETDAVGPKPQPKPCPVSPYLDAYGQYIFINSAIMYRTGGGHGEWVMLLIGEAGCDTFTGCWTLQGKTCYGHTYLVYGRIGERHSRLAVLAAHADEVILA
jgi:hypothetical protein